MQLSTVLPEPPRGSLRTEGIFMFSVSSPSCPHSFLFRFWESPACQVCCVRGKAVKCRETRKETWWPEQEQNKNTVLSDVHQSPFYALGTSIAFLLGSNVCHSFTHSACLHYASSVCQDVAGAEICPLTKKHEDSSLLQRLDALCLGKGKAETMGSAFD